MRYMTGYFKLLKKCSMIVSTVKITDDLSHAVLRMISISYEFHSMDKHTVSKSALTFLRMKRSKAF